MTLICRNDILFLNFNNNRLTITAGQVNPPSPMEIVCDEEEYPDVPTSNKNQNGWFWFGGIAGLNQNPKEAMKEALEKLGSR